MHQGSRVILGVPRLWPELPRVSIPLPFGRAMVMSGVCGCVDVCAFVFVCMCVSVRGVRARVVRMNSWFFGGRL
jgi:hypothetical protein